MSWKIQKLKLALNNFFKKIRFIVEACITYSYEWRMLKVFLAIVDDFNWQFFLVRQP